MRRLLIATRGGSGFHPVPVSIDVEFAWVGAVTGTSAVVKARVEDAVAVALYHDTDPAFGSPTYLGGIEGSDDVWTFELTDLAPDTVHHFGFMGSALTGQVRTFPTEGSFLVAAASCAGNPTAGSGAEYVTGPANTSDSPAFDRIHDREPVLFIHMGDLHYRDISTDSVASFRQAYRDVLANDRQHDLYRTVPFAYTWDDHDFGGNNSDGTSAARPAAQEAFRDYVPHYDLPADTRMAGDGEIYQTFVIGRVRFVLLDCRSERSPNGNTDNSSKTMLGADQKAWLMDTLLAATEPVIVLVGGPPWNGDLPDNWGSFSTERQELWEFFEAEGITSRLFLLHGDMHALMGDDGTNTQYDPASMNDGPPLAGFAPLDQGATTYSGTYTIAPSTDSNQQYGTLEFDDQGSQIVVTVRGYEVSDLTEVQDFTFQHTYAA